MTERSQDRVEHQVQLPAHVFSKEAQYQIVILLKLMAVALVDFPFHRPAGWALFSVLASVDKER